ncbi:hypothetical protein SCLCIDRAFT_1219253 [Scleroderma citrinum Foug A]|uniref:Uncharacterized protein n=1 Tax=Scleroderma citrinum Foug A TaxID=1036808 RepID=A0A0C2Z6W6_9AGAM|nr:hypothetical protein SCLCIDRAFT_1219253 [Scleroderma citrinum Foug A]
MSPPSSFPFPCLCLSPLTLCPVVVVVVAIVTDFISSVIGIVIVIDGSFFTSSPSSPTWSSLS